MVPVLPQQMLDAQYMHQPPKHIFLSKKIVYVELVVWLLHKLKWGHVVAVAQKISVAAVWRVLLFITYIKLQGSWWPSAMAAQVGDRYFCNNKIPTKTFF